MAPLVGSMWDKKQTLAQNYARLGLCVNLNGSAGGSGLEAKEAILNRERINMLKDNVEFRAIYEPAADSVSKDDNVESQVFDRIEPDIAVDDFAVKIGEKVDPSLALGMTEDARKLEHMFLTQISNEKKLVRKSSEQEQIIFSLLKKKYIHINERHGDDYASMARDIKLNKYQLTAGQLKKRFARLEN